MHQITYVVKVKFPESTPPQAQHLWADAIARGIQHNKDEVVSVEYDIQEVNNDFEVQQEVARMESGKKQLPPSTQEG